MNDVSTGKMSANGTDIVYIEQGNGPPVVFVHGAFADHRVWEPQRETIAKQYRFIAVDLRYFGTAPWADAGERFSPATHAADLAAFIRGSGAGRVYLVARSYGSTVSLLTAIQHPDLVRGIFIHEPQSPSLLTDPSEQRIFADDRKGIAPIQAAANADAVLATRLMWEFVNDQPGGFDALSAASKAMHLDNARTVPLQLNAPPANITCAQAGQLRIPVAITRGEFTRASYKVIAEATQRCIRGSDLIVIPGGKHNAPSRQSAAFNEALLAFLARHS